MLGRETPYTPHRHSRLCTLHLSDCCWGNYDPRRGEREIRRLLWVAGDWSFLQSVRASGRQQTSIIEQIAKKSMTSATSSVGKSCNSGLSRPLEGSSKSHANQKYSPVTNVNALAFTARIEQRSECCSSRTVTVILWYCLFNLPLQCTVLMGNCERSFCIVCPL